MCLGRPTGASALATLATMSPTGEAIQLLDLNGK